MGWFMTEVINNIDGCYNHSNSRGFRAFHDIRIRLPNREVYSFGDNLQTLLLGNVEMIPNLIIGEKRFSDKLGCLLL